MGIVRAKMVYLKIPNISESQHYLQLYIMQILTTYHLFANDSIASTIMQQI